MSQRTSRLTANTCSARSLAIRSPSPKKLAVAVADEHALQAACVGTAASCVYSLSAARRICTAFHCRGNSDVRYERRAAGCPAAWPPSGASHLASLRKLGYSGYRSATPILKALSAAQPGKRVLGRASCHELCFNSREPTSRAVVTVPTPIGAGIPIRLGVSQLPMQGSSETTRGEHRVCAG